MQQQLKKLVIVPFTFFLISTVSAQQKKIKETNSPAGFWVIESNVATPLDHVIFFYTTNEELVYTETLKGVKLKLRKRKTIDRLNNVLATSILAWQKNKLPEKNKELVSVKLKN